MVITLMTSPILFIKEKGKYFIFLFFQNIFLKKNVMFVWCLIDPCYSYLIKFWIFEEEKNFKFLTPIFIFVFHFYFSLSVSIAYCIHIRNNMRTHKYTCWKIECHEIYVFNSFLFLNEKLFWKKGFHFSSKKLMLT